MEEKQICQTCKHFRQHYIKWGDDSYHICRSGHCVYPRRKPRYNNTEACQHYKAKEAAE